MKRRLALVLAGLMVFALVAGASASAFAQQDPTAGMAAIPKNKPDSTELVNHMKVDGDVAKGLYWNGKTITFHGEAVGERMVRGDYAWIHLNDDAYMEKNVEEGAKLGGYNSGMAVWIPAKLTDAIDTFGTYKHEGAIVEITGVFNGACAEHGGDLDIHATSLKVLRPGRPAIDYIHPWKVALAIGLSLVAALLYWLEQRRRARVLQGRVA